MSAYVAIRQYGQAAVASGGYMRDITGYATGGTPRRSYPAGGRVTGAGTTTSDSVPALLSRDEFVVRAAAVQHYGPALLYALNARRLPKHLLPGYADGGRVEARPRLLADTSTSTYQTQAPVSASVDLAGIEAAVAAGLAGARILIDGRAIDARIETAHSMVARRYQRGA